MCQAFARLGHEVALFAFAGSQPADDAMTFYGIKHNFRLEYGPHIARLLIEYDHDEAALERMFAAIASATTNVNLYSGLLGRGGTYAPEEHRRDDELDRLAAFVMARAKQPYAEVPSGIETGSW